MLSRREALGAMALAVTTKPAVPLTITPEAIQKHFCGFLQNAIAGEPFPFIQFTTLHVQRGGVLYRLFASVHRSKKTALAVNYNPLHAITMSQKMAWACKTSLGTGIDRHHDWSVLREFISVHGAPRTAAMSISTISDAMSKGWDVYDLIKE